MKPGIPWSVKGIEPEVREAAKHAARRSGMTLGEWLNSVILDQAEDSASPQQPVAPSAQKEIPAMMSDAPTRARSETTIRLEDIAQQLSALAKREQESATIRPYEAPRQPGVDHDTVNRILDRIEQNERQSVEAFTAMNERLAILGRQLTQNQPAKAFEKPEDVPGFQALEGALRNIVDHIEISERRTRDSLKSMQDRMAEMTLKASHASGDDIVRAAPAFASLEARLSELAVRVQRNEANSEVGFNDIIKREVGQLTSRIDNVHRHAEQLAASAQTAATQSAQRELRDIENRIQSLLRETQDTIAHQTVGQAEVQKLRSEIGHLTQRIDDVRGGAASARDVHALQSAVEQLSARMAQGPDLRPLADMDRKLADITQRLELDRNNPRHLSQLGELEQRIAELDHRLGEVIRLQGDGQAMQALESHIHEVNGRLANAEQQLGHLDTIERAITQLFDGLEQQRGETTRAIEETARRVSAQQPSLQGAPEILALEQGLRAVRESADQSDRRSQETLEAVHETLEQIVAKLAELETSAAGHQLAANLAQQAQATASQTPQQPQPQQWQEPQPQQWQEPQPQWQDPPAAHQMQAAPGFDPVDAIPEPQFTAPQAPLQNPFTVAEPQPQMPQAPVIDFGQPAQQDDLPSDDFIAAARRAAQVAAGRPATVTTLERPKAKRGANSRFGFSLPFRGKAAKATAAATATHAAAPQQVPILKAPADASSKRRKLILAGIVLLAAVSAITFSMMSRGKPVKPATSAIEQPVEPAPKSKPKAPANTSSLGSPAADLATIASNTGMPAPDGSTYDAPGDFSDITGSIGAAGKTDASVASLVAEPGSSATAVDMPPPEVGTMALRQAAGSGDARAQFVVATRYLDGDGIEQDVTKAAYWYQTAATQGLAPAQYRVATLYERGKGVPKDVATALVWYERAATGGNVKAMHNAAVIAASTESGTPDYAKAFTWFKAAAERGLQDSQFNLAVLYQRGLGTTADLREAYFWFAMAGANNDADAQARADKLAEQLKPDEVLALKSRLATFTPAPTDANANAVTIEEESWKGSGSASISTVPDPMNGGTVTVNPIERVQTMLTKLGYNVGTPDGKMGGRTANAIRLFQLQSGLPVTGDLSPELEDALAKQTGGA